MALPMDLRLELALQLLIGTGLTARMVESDTNGCIVAAVASIAKETGEGIAALVAINKNSTPLQIQAAKRELTEAHQATGDGLNVIESWEVAAGNV